MHLNTRQIILNYRLPNDQSVLVLDQLILAFGYNYDHIGIKQVCSPENPRDRVDKSSPNYYIIETKSGNVTGPMTKQEFDAAVKERNIKWDVWKCT